MRVILLQNVDGVGQKDDVKNVKPGYWRNFLMSQNLAVEATPQLLKEIEEKKKKEIKQKQLAEKKSLESVKKIKSKILEIEVKADGKGNLFAGIDSKKISEFIKKKLGLEIPAEFIELKKPIKKIGPYEIPIKDIILKLEIKPAPH